MGGVTSQDLLRDLDGLEEEISNYIQAVEKSESEITDKTLASKKLASIILGLPEPSLRGFDSRELRVMWDRLASVMKKTRDYINGETISSSNKAVVRQCPPKIMLKRNI